MNRINNTELILNPNKKIYHLNLSKDQIGDDILLVGDPDRVAMISSKFDKIEHCIQHREFITHTGIINKKRITALSTGIGTDNIDIVINELDALVNIDFDKRIENKNKKTLNIIRLGTSGALQKNINIDTLLVSSFGLGLDNLAHFYSNKEVLENKMTNKFTQHANWPNNLSKPYFVKATPKLMHLFSDLESGITATAPGFYGPQSRQIRLSTSIPELHKKMESFRFNGQKISNFEMETSALYYLGQTLGHNTITICSVIGNRITEKYSINHKKIINTMINTVLERICY